MSCDGVRGLRRIQVLLYLGREFAGQSLFLPPRTVSWLLQLLNPTIWNRLEVANRNVKSFDPHYPHRSLSLFHPFGPTHHLYRNFTLEPQVSRSQPLLPLSLTSLLRLLLHQFVIKSSLLLFLGRQLWDLLALLLGQVAVYLPLLPLDQRPMH